MRPAKIDDASAAALAVAVQRVSWELPKAA